MLVLNPGLATQWTSVAEELADMLSVPVDVGAVVDNAPLPRSTSRLIISSPVSLLPHLANGSVQLNRLSMAAITEADSLMSNSKYETVSAKAAKDVLGTPQPGAHRQLLMAMTARTGSQKRWHSPPTEPDCTTADSHTDCTAGSHTPRRIVVSSHSLHTPGRARGARVRRRDDARPPAPRHRRGGSQPRERDEQRLLRRRVLSVVGRETPLN